METVRINQALLKELEYAILLCNAKSPNNFIEINHDNITH